MKKTAICIMATLVLMVLGQVGFAAENMTLQAKHDREMANKQSATTFFQLILGDRDYEAARKYVAEYIQLDPNVSGDGFDTLIHYLETDPKFKNRPKTKVKFYNIIADTDLVYFQIRKELKAKDDGSPMRILVQHSFRFNKAGKIAEHLGTATPVKLKNSKNKHPLW